MTEVAQPEQADVSAGALLRRAREAAGLHVGALAVSLKVPVRKLEALEEDRFGDLGDPVFVRALASSVCRTLKVDPQPVLERLPQTSAPRLVKDTDGLNAPFRAPGDGPAPTWVDRIRQPVPLFVIALVGGAAIIALAPIPHFDEETAVAAPVPSRAAPPPAVAVTQVDPPAVNAASMAPAVPEGKPPQVAASTPAIAVAVPVPAASGPATAALAAAAASGIVVIRAKGESWVEVVDAKGAVAVRKIMAPGESAGAAGALPLVVTIGKVDMTEVEVRGRKFDMRPVSKDNVARFTVR